MSKRNLLIITLTAGLLLLTCTAWLLWQHRLYRTDNFRARDGEEHAYYIYPGTDADSLLSLLLADYDLRSPRSWQRHCRHLGYTAPAPGFYRFPPQMGSQPLLRRLIHGEQTPVRLTFRNTVRTHAQLAGRLSRQLLLDSLDIQVRLDSADYMQQFGLTPQTAVCLFLPDTYEVWWTMTADELFARMNREYRRFWNDRRRAEADALGLTPAQVTTLASIVESETNKQAEFPLIASLYLNRLRIGMLLQACPTAIYANGDFTLRRVLKRHTAIDSPYNTYRYPGLPPGPIRCTRALTIDSVLHAPATDYLYMCANPDFSGTHVFSSTYARHAATARRYQQELNRRKIR
ncbi:MAG: endolytic transglycosylase MltG [Paludibacteraceae bacterium]|nr:endolytic transglycosylase MltG [Paludibacteraceae bacterium]